MVWLKRGGTRFIWRVKNFIELPHLPDERIDSSKFSIGVYEFCMSLYPKGHDGPENISVYLKRLDDNGAAEVFTRFKICIVSYGSYSVRLDKIYAKNSMWGTNILIKRNELLNKKSVLLPDNNLTIRCDVFSLSVMESNVGKFNDIRDAELLSRDFSEILNSGLHSDLVLVVDGKKYKVHKVILECRCPKLISELQETAVINEYMLTGVSAPAVAILLQYLYTGTLSMTNMHEEILAVSDMYNISDIRHLLTFPYCKTINAVSESAVSRRSFKWNITKLNEVQPNEELVHPVFFITSDEWSKMIIQTNKKSEICGIQLRIRKLNCNKVGFIRYKFSIYSHSDYSYVVIKEHIFTSGNDWIIPFGPEFNGKNYSINDTLHMQLELSMNETHSKIENILVETKTLKAGDEVARSLNVLQKEFGNLYNDDDPKSSDITLSVGEIKYRVHKVVLCARSRVFAKMFEHDTLESKEGVVTIKDISPETVSSMLLYIYCGYIIKMEISEAIKLYAAADKFELISLRDKCANFLKISMNADHVGEILLLADAHHDEDLRKGVFDYMTSNPKNVRMSENGLGVLENRIDMYRDILNACLDHMTLKDSNSVDSN